MSTEDLETYQVQLAQVQEALTADPENLELSSLRSELEELIKLTKAALAQLEASSTSSKPENSRKANNNVSAHAWTAGSDCLAKYSSDGQWYPARIISIGGSTENRVYSVVFKGYNNTELVKGSEIKALPANYSIAALASSNKRKLTKEEEEERERKKKKNEKKVEAKAQKAKEQMEKQVTWQKFTKKSEKKGVHIAGVAGTSIFKTPDNPLGRVGVTGSGKPMSAHVTATKHKFSPADAEQ